MLDREKVLVRAADGVERELILLSVSGDTAYVCAPNRYNEAVANPDLAVGFPVRDVKRINEEAAN